MTQEIFIEQSSETNERRGRGPSKPYPSTTFEEALYLPRSILEHGYDGQINRLTLLSKIGWSPNSSKTRGLISSSYRYGLTEGSYNAPSLSVTADGHIASAPDYSVRDTKEKGFQLAIAQFTPFQTVYDKLKNQRLREGAVLNDEFGRAGVASSDCQQAAEIFTENLRFLGLVRDVSGSDYVKSIDQALEELPESTEDSPPEPPNPEPPVEIIPSSERNGKPTLATNRPALHIDIQVHIDPTSSAEQIDQIFASMAKHLYRTEP